MSVCIVSLTFFPSLAVIRGIRAHMWTVPSSSHRFKPFHLLTKSSSRFDMIMVVDDYGHLFSHASSTLLVG